MYCHRPLLVGSRGGVAGEVSVVDDGRGGGGGGGASGKHADQGYLSGSCGSSS